MIKHIKLIFSAFTVSKFIPYPGAAVCMIYYAPKAWVQNGRQHINHTAIDGCISSDPDVHGLTCFVERGFFLHVFAESSESFQAFLVLNHLVLRRLASIVSKALLLLATVQAFGWILQMMFLWLFRTLQSICNSVYSWVMLRLCCSIFSTKRVPRWHMYLESLSCSSQRRTWLVQMDKTACWLHIMERCLTTNSSGYSSIVLDSNCLGVAGCGCNCSVEDSCCI